MTEHPPEPGLVRDPQHGLPGPAEALPASDRYTDAPTQVNDDDDEVDDEAFS